MIALIDPAIFVWPAPMGQLSEKDEKAFASIVGQALLTCRAAGAKIGNIDGYWDRLWKDFVEPLRARLRTQPAKAAIDELRKLSGQRSVFPAAPLTTKVWGFRSLFGQTPVLMPVDWAERIGAAAAQLFVAQQSVLMLVRLVPGRNVKEHRGKQHVTLLEVTRWCLYVRPPGFAAHQRIDCVRTPQQIHRRWTTRYDERLPTQHDNARYPFCLPPDWHRVRVQAVGTMEAAPAWIDAAGRGWTRPNIPGGAGHHWDVFFSDPRLKAEIGVDQINIVEFGAPPAQGRPGELHHVPNEKQGRVKDVGWACR